MQWETARCARRPGPLLHLLFRKQGSPGAAGDQRGDQLGQGGVGVWAVCKVKATDTEGASFHGW